MSQQLDHVAGRVLAVVLIAAVSLPPTAVAQDGNRLIEWLTSMQGRNRQTEAAHQQIAPPQQQQQHEDVVNTGSISRRPSGLVDIHVRNASIATILEMLSYEFRLNIVATDGVDKRVSANLFGVTLDEALEAILTPRQYTYHRAGKVIYVGTPEEIAELLPPPATRVFYLEYLARDEAARAVRALLSPAGNVVGDENANSLSPGGGQGGAGTMGTEVNAKASLNYLVVTDYPERLVEIERLLKELDVRPKQVLIEATILRATLNEDNAFGVDFTLLGGVDFQNVGSTSNASSDLRTGQLPADEFQNTSFNINTNFVGNLPNGFSFGIIKDSVAAFVQALEDVTDVTVVANPKVVALNHQSAEVIVGRRDGYLTTTVTETAAVQSVEFLETGTQIRFRPVINRDGTVRLEVHPKDSNGGLTADNLPFEETTEARAQVVVRDGHTVLIGGLFRERTVGSQSQLPVLGDIPGAGVLFQRSLDQTIREEVIILLTIHILGDDDQQAEFNEQVLDDVERIRVGSRRGLLGFGRERLAQAFYQEALQQYEKGNTDRALLNVRMSLHNNPKHVAALKLRDRLLLAPEWESDGTRSHTMLLEMLEDKPPAGPELQRPAIDWEVLRERTHGKPGPSQKPATSPRRSDNPVQIEDVP